MKKTNESGKSETPANAVGSMDELLIKKYFFDAAPSGNSTADINGLIDYVNASFVKMLGYSSREEVIGRPIADFMADTNETADILASLNSTGKWEGYTTGKRKDGSTFSGRSMASILTDDNGRVTGYMSAIEDITEKKKIQDELDAISKQLRNISGNLAQGMVYQITCSPDLSSRRFSYVSPAVERFHGLKIEDVLNDPMLLYNQVIEEDRVMVRQHELDALKRMNKLDVEVRVRLPSGDINWRHFISAPRVIQNGDIVWDGIELDITDRKATEEKLNGNIKQLHELQSIIDQSDSIAFIWRHEPGRWTVEYVSNNIERILGYSVLEIITEKATWPGITHPEDVSRLEKEVAEYLAKGEKSWSQEYRLITKSGEIKWFRDNNLAIAGPDGNITRVQAVVHDITRFIEAQEELHRQREYLIHMERVSRMGELASSIAHEINQPLMGIRSNAQSAQRMIDTENADLTDIREILANIIYDEKRVSEVIQRLRSLLKKDISFYRDIDINGQIIEICKVVESEMTLGDVSLSVKLMPDIPSVHADPIQIQQVLLNLIINAQQAMKDRPAGRKKEIRVITSVEQEDRVRFCVEDNGPGIDHESFKHIFEPFYTTKPHGMGMGLPICRSIIESHRGKIWAENRPEGGARLCCSLPTTHGDSI